MIGSSSHCNYIHSFPPETQNKDFSHNTNLFSKCFWNACWDMVWCHIQPYCQYNNKAVRVSEKNCASMWHYGEEVQCLMQYAEISAVYTQLKAGGIRIQAWCKTHIGTNMSINYSKPSRSNYAFSCTIIYICTSGNCFETSWAMTYFSYMKFLEILMEIYR